MAKTSPTQRTLDECRRRGWVCQVVEYWQPNFQSNNVIAAARSVIDSGEYYPGAIALLDQLRETLESYQRGGPGKRKDLFGCIDVIAVTPDCILGIQATTNSNQANRVSKILEECSEAAEAWINSGNRLAVWGWKKYAKAVDRRFWRVTETEITSELITPALPF